MYLESRHSIAFSSMAMEGASLLSSILLGFHLHAIEFEFGLNSSPFFILF